MSASLLLAIADVSLNVMGTTRAARLQPQTVTSWWASLPVCTRPRGQILTFRSSDVLYLRMGAESLMMGAPFPYSQVPAQLQSTMTVFLKLLSVSRGGSAGLCITISRQGMFKITKEKMRIYLVIRSELHRTEVVCRSPSKYKAL